MREQNIEAFRIRQASAVRQASTSGLPNSHVSLKQWNLLRTVIEAGSYSRAGKILHISQPAISYTISRMEERIGVSILKMDGRRASLTEAGKKLLQRVEPLLDQACDVEEFVASLRDSWKPDIRLAIEDRFPIQMLLPTLKRFSLARHSANVLVFEGSSIQVRKMLKEKEVQVAIVTELDEVFSGQLLLRSEYVPVAHPGHPVFNCGRPVHWSDLENDVLVTMPEPRDAARALPATASLPRKWEVGSLERVEKAIADGIGFGWLPRQQAQPLLAQGRLRILPISDHCAEGACFHIAHHAHTVPCTETNRLIAALQTAVSQDGTHSQVENYTPPSSLSCAAFEHKAG